MARQCGSNRWAATAVSHVPLTSGAIVLLAALLGACATGNSGAISRPVGMALQHEEAALVESEAPVTTGSNKIFRRGSAVAQGGVILTRSFPIDPINRPVSNAMSISSYVVKSVAGFLHRVTIDTVAFPALENRPVPDVAFAGTMDLDQWEQDLDRMTGTGSSAGTIELLVDGEEYFTRMLDAVDEAQESIDIRTYIFDNDDFALQVADRLREKSATVKVRVMFDGLGNLMATQTDAESMPGDFEGPASIENYLQRNSGVKVRALSNPWLTGDHTKTTIIDREVAFIGGMNIGREYRHDWHDLMMEVRGPIVNRLQFDTDKAWARAGIFGDAAHLVAVLRGPKKQRAEDAGYPVRALYTHNFDSQIYRAQLEAIRRARSYILIQNSYFSDDATLYELARARRRGVDVRVILPGESNHGSLAASNNVAINKMVRNGIRVYRYPGMSHVKATVVDGWASIGTANFDKLSLQVNKEINLATSHPPFVNELLDRVFLPDLARATEVREPFDVTLQDRILEMVADEML